MLQHNMHFQFCILNLILLGIEKGSAVFITQLIQLGIEWNWMGYIVQQKSLGPPRQPFISDTKNKSTNASTLYEHCRLLFVSSQMSGNAQSRSKTK